MRSGRAGDATAATAAGSSHREGGLESLVYLEVTRTHRPVARTEGRALHSRLLRLPHLRVLVLSTHGSEHVTWAVLLSTFSYNRSAVVSWRKRVPLIRHFCHFLPYSTLSVLCGIFLTWIWDPVEGHVLRYTCHMVISMWLSAVNRSLASPWTCLCQSEFRDFFNVLHLLLPFSCSSFPSVVSESPSTCSRVLDMPQSLPSTSSLARNVPISPRNLDLQEILVGRRAATQTSKREFEQMREG